MTPAKYATIVADPPWPYDAVPALHHQKSNKGIRARTLPYPSMTVEEIKALPVQSVAAPDSRLFMWTTNKFLRDAFTVMDAWGFQYRQTVGWQKPRGPFSAHVSTNNLEFMLVGTRGNPKTLERWPSAVVATSQPHTKGPNHGPDHSAKPEVFLDLIEQVSPGPYLELFARRNRLGWNTWGNEALNHVEIGEAG